MQPKIPLSEVDRLKSLVGWLEEQLNGHEDNFGKQIDKINHLQDLLERTQKELLEANQRRELDEAKLASLAAYFAALEEAPLLKVLKPSNRRELRVQATVTAYEAAALKGFFKEIIDIVNTDVPEGEEYNLVTQLREYLSRVDKDIDFHRRRITEAV